MQLRKVSNSVIQNMRGIAIILVLIWHSISQVEQDNFLNGVGQIIICFHMPVFFVISGYLFQHNIDKYYTQGKCEFIINRAKHLLVPYVFWTLLLWLGVNITGVINNDLSSKLSEFGFYPMSIGDMLWGIITYEKYYTQHLWFLYVLFFLFIFNIFMPQIGKDITCVCMWFALGLISINISIPHIIARLLVWGCFFSIGRFVEDNKSKIKYITERTEFKTISIIVFVFFGFLRIISYSVGGNVFYRIIIQVIKYIEGIAGVAIIYIISKEINGFKVLNTVGNYSYDIYLMHNPYIVALTSVILNKILGINSYISLIVSVFLGIIVPILISHYVLRHNEKIANITLGINVK